MDDVDQGPPKGPPKGPPRILNFILPNGNTYIKFVRDKKSFDEVLNKSLYKANDAVKWVHKDVKYKKEKKSSNEEEMGESPDSVVSIKASKSPDQITYEWGATQKSVILPDTFNRQYIDIIGLWGTLLYFDTNASNENKDESNNAICMIFIEQKGNSETFYIQIYEKKVPDNELRQIDLASDLINDQHKIEHLTLDSIEKLDIQLDLSKPIPQDMFIRKVDEGVRPVALKNPNFIKYLVGGNPSPHVHTGQRGGRFVMVGGRKRYLRK
jgi:hypothetical protein